MAVQLGTKIVDRLLLGRGERRRQLQDLPILGDVWSRLAKDPAEPPDLLIIPTWEKSAADIAAIVKKRGERQNQLNKDDRSVAYLNGLVVATLTLDDIIEDVFPGTQWWDKIEDRWREGNSRPSDEQLHAWIEAELACALGQEVADEAAPSASHDQQAARLGLLLGTYLAAAEDIKVTDGQAAPDATADLNAVVEYLNPQRIVGRGTGAVTKIMRRYADPDAHFAANDWNGVIFQVTLNRPAEMALTNSVAAIKGDAARSLFSISCKKVAWAVLDSGIDHTHPAFWDQEEVSKRLAKARSTGGAADAKLSFYPHRIKGAFEFRRIRAILGVKQETIDAIVDEIAKWSATPPERIRELLQGIMADREDSLPIDWRKIEPLIELDIQEPKKAKASDAAVPPPPPRKIELPRHPHGTHVAGIIGADWQKDGAIELQGVCPDIALYDCRVLGSDLGDSEFAVSAALQFIRFYNEQGGHPRINGVNMSLSIRHNVRNYACGRTPVCVEAEALVSSGVVVVAAAGNRGFQEYQLADSSTFEGYAASSITDPGNADGVITVGSTHRAWPHTYGVSFFSSRGPTGDGRMKPDLLAPGEKIVSCVPRGSRDEMDGTSMAAPHVSGAAALLIARHEELKGRPTKVKEVLCATATDLNRERSFQGHGMVDVLRAIQSL